MSSLEYLDLFLKSQSNPNSHYHVFTFDIVNSKDLNPKDYVIVKNNLFHTINDMFVLLKKIELKTNKNILVYKEFINDSDGFGLKKEPFIFGDMMGFTIYRDSLSTKQIMDMFTKIKNDHNFNYPLHYANGYYETNNYEEGNKKFFRGYCIDILSNIHKEYYKSKILSKSKK